LGGMLHVLETPRVQPEEGLPVAIQRLPQIHASKPVAVVNVLGQKLVRRLLIQPSSCMPWQLDGE
jgi:hypothetical protein